MASPDDKVSLLQWLCGVALVAGERPLPFRACASKSALRAVASSPPVEVDPSAETGLRLIINDDHGMTPTVTIVNRTDETITVRALRPSVLSTDNGTYDLDALLANAHPTVEPGAPLVLRITDIGRNAGEPFRISAAGRPSRPVGG